MVSKEVYMPEDMNNSQPSSNKDNGNGRNPHPARNEPLEKRIRGLIQDQAYSTGLGKRMFADSRSLLVPYFRDSLVNLNNPQLIHDRTQELLHQLATVTNAKIVDGEEKIDLLPKKSPIFAAVNHYSGYKLMNIEQSEFGTNLSGMDDVVPFPFFYSSLSPVADKLGDYLYDAHLEMPGAFGQVQEKAGLLVIPEEQNAFEDIKRKTQEMISRRSNSLIVIFPEGATSGKRNMGGPYDLDRFHGGSFAIAEELGIPVIPVCQYFNPNSGFEIGVLPPVKFDNPPPIENEDARRKYFSFAAENTRQQMQAWLDQRQK